MLECVENFKFKYRYLSEVLGATTQITRKLKSITESSIDVGTRLGSCLQRSSAPICNSSARLNLDTVGPRLGRHLVRSCTPEHGPNGHFSQQAKRFLTKRVSDVCSAPRSEATRFIRPLLMFLACEHASAQVWLETYDTMHNASRSRDMANDLRSFDQSFVIMVVSSDLLAGGDWGN